MTNTCEEDDKDQAEQQKVRNTDELNVKKTPTDMRHKENTAEFFLYKVISSSFWQLYPNIFSLSLLVFTQILLEIIIKIISK